jgi:hypothetical protein
VNGRLLNGCGLQPSSQGRTALQLLRERSDCPQGGRTDVMFHSFNIIMNHAVIQTEQSQEIGEEPVSLGDFAGKFFARCC